MFFDHKEDNILLVNVESYSKYFAQLAHKRVICKKGFEMPRSYVAVFKVPDGAEAREKEDKREIHFHATFYGGQVPYLVQRKTDEEVISIIGRERTIA